MLEHPTSISPDTPEVGAEGICPEWRVVARQYCGPGQMVWDYLIPVKELHRDVDAGRVVTVTGRMDRGYVLYAKIAKR